MAHPFPEESVKIISEQLDVFLKLDTSIRKTKINFAHSIALGIGKMDYGFEKQLFKGNYFHWPHESLEQHISEVNCTTIIPYLYLSAEHAGLYPEIIEFVNASDTQKYRMSNYPPMEMKSHYGIIISVDRKQRYLLDTTMDAFGPILEQTDTFMRIGKYKKYSAIKRKYDRAIVRTAEEFTEMFNSAKEEGNDLDVLAAGQRIFMDKLFANVASTMMVFYDDAETKIYARLYIPQVNISDKVIFCNTFMDDDGAIQRRTLDFYTARAPHWDSLLRQRYMGSSTIKTMLSLQKEAKTLGKTKKNRLGPLFLDSSSSEKASLLEIISEIDAQMSEEQKKGIHRQVLIRSLYEAHESSKSFIYSEEQQDERMRFLFEEENRLIMEENPFKHQYIGYSWGINKLTSSEAGKLQRKELAIKRKRGKVSIELKQLMNSFHYEKDVYKRTRDMVLFAKEKEHCSISDLESELQKQDLDLHLGRIAMLHDYVPFLQKETRGFLELDLFLEHVQRKVRIRRQKSK
ncbi:MAG: hypothetical protein Q8R18_06070 [bacterium]|nr:hypothetical protein [bacterium]